MKAMVLLSVVALAACAPTQSVTKRHTAGQPPEYKQGFEAGCGSGYVAAGHPYAKFAKDVQAYADQGLYKQGWDDGFSVCKGEYSHITR